MIYVIEANKRKSHGKCCPSFTHNELDKCMHTQNTTKKPNFLYIDEYLTDYILNQNKEFDLCCVEYDYKLAFNEWFYPNNKSEVQYDT